MTLNDAFEGHAIQPARMAQKAALLMAAAASLLLVFRGRSAAAMIGGLALGTVVIPAILMLARGLITKMRQRRTEERLLMHTRVFLSSQEPACLAAAVPVPVPAEGAPAERLWAALERAGRRLPEQGFFGFRESAAPLPDGEPVVFDALPRRYAVRGTYERRMASLASALPKPVMMPFRELLPAAPAKEFESVPANRQNLTIEYSSAVLDEIRMRAAEGYQRMRHGGVEVGGVLFGTHGNGVVRILAVRPIECDYSNGPRFVLSPRDETALAELLAGGDDPALAGLEPVGWYHSHTREEIRLSPSDVRLFDRFFPLAWQVALVVRPANLAPTRAGFFFREANGALRTESSCRELQLGPAAAAAA